MADESFEVELRIDLNSADLRAELSRSLGELNNGVTGFDKKIKGVQGTLDTTSNSAKGLATNLSTTRYALYDVSSTLAITGAALLGVAVATSAVAVAWERDFAQVIRTTGVTGASVGKLRDDIVDLAQAMPVAFSDLTKIATLGGQLGVAQDDIANFTEVVAKFSAVTDVSVEAAATAFGRLDALLPDVNGNFEALGSSIAKVGVNSVATESQIIAISTQISSMGSFAGLTADQVVGLSGALASVGAAPELSRGTVTRLFTEMSEAVSEGGDKLEAFAKVAGVSGDQFSASFGTSRFGPVFQSFIEGLSNTERTGGNAVAMLKELGIQSVRDVPLLLRLSGAGNLLGDSFRDAADGFSSASELNRQYGIIADTAAAQIQRLLNNFQSFLDAAGSGSLGTLTDAISFLADAFGNLADFVATDTGSRIVTIVIALGAMVGVATLAAAALALFGASSIGLRQGLQGIVALSPAVSGALIGTANAAAIANGSMTAATVGAKALGVALKALSLIGVALILPDIANWFDDGIRGAQGLSNSFDALADRLKGSEFKGDLFLGGDLTKMDASFVAIGRTLGDVANRGFGDIRRMDEELKRMADGGQLQTVRKEYEALQSTWLAGGGSLESFKAAFIDTTAALEGSRGAAANGSTTFATLDEAMQATQAEAQETETAINELRDAILTFGETGINAEQAGINFQKALNDLQAAAANADATLDGTNQASLDLKQSFLDTDKSARDAALGIIETGGSLEQATAKYNEGREAIIQARIARGEDATAARAWADRVLGTSGEAQAAIQAYINKLNTVPERKDTRIYVDASGAYREVDSLVSYINSRTATMTVNQRVIYESSVLSGGRGRLTMATGGYVSGPGTGTSDSIPARLSNGEFVMNAAAVQKYGTNFMSALNSGRVTHFAGGGQAGAPVASAGSGIMELGPRTMRGLASALTVQVMNNLDDVSISRSAERGNKIRRSTGDINA